jgi:hypothetical protein
MERMLNGKLKLGDIDDVEMFCQIRINAYIKKRNMRLRPDDFEDLMSFAMAQVWELFDSKWNNRGSFAGYAGYILPKRFTDYFRAKWGRDGQKLSVESAIPFSAMGATTTGFSDYDKADSASYIGGVFLR